MPPRYSETEARDAIAASSSYAAALRRLGMCPSGGNWKTLRRYAVEVWSIPVEHFRPTAQLRVNLRAGPTPLEEILVERSTFSRNHLKQRLYAEGLKAPVCELCGQGEYWRARKMGLILDHVNGVRDDNRLPNLRIVCPNCAATLETHCGRKNRVVRPRRACERCGATFSARYATQRYCSRACGQRWDRSGRVRPGARRVERPPYEQLMTEIREAGYAAVGRRYGVSDNAIRKWVRQYRRESEAAQLPRAA